MKPETLKEIENSLPEGFKIVNINDTYVSCKYQLADKVELTFLASVCSSGRLDYYGYSLRGNDEEVFKYVMHNLYKGETNEY